MDVSNAMFYTRKYLGIESVWINGITVERSLLACQGIAGRGVEGGCCVILQASARDRMVTGRVSRDAVFRALQNLRTKLPGLRLFPYP
jgi:hypothetical protein